MSVLSTFYYTVDVDAEPLLLAFTEADKTASGLTKSVINLKDESDKLGKTFLSLADNAANFLNIQLDLAGLAELTVQTAEATSVLGQQAEMVGINVSVLDAWRKAVTASGGDADAFTNTLGKLAQQFLDPEAALLRMSQTLGGMGKLEALNTGKMLGLDESTIELLRQGSTSVVALVQKQKEQGVVTQEQVELADRFNRKWRDFTAEIENVRSGIGTALLPVFEVLLDIWSETSDWVKENKEALSDFFLSLATVVTAYYLPAMASAGLASLAAVWPMLLLAAAFAAVALVISDVIGYFRGMDSVTGDLVKQFPLLGSVLNIIKDIVLECWNALVFLLTDPGRFLEVLKAQFIGFGATLLYLFANPLEMLRLLKNSLMEFIDLIYGEGTSESIMNSIGASVDYLYELLGKLKKILLEALDLVFGEDTGATVMDFISASVENLTGLWEILKKLISDVLAQALNGFNDIKDTWSSVKAWFGFGDTQESSNIGASSNTSYLGYDIPKSLTYGGNEYWRQISLNPINAQTSNAVNNASHMDNKEYNFNFGKVEINTQASDPQSIVDDFENAVLKSTTDHFANGFSG